MIAGNLLCVAADSPSAKAENTSSSGAGFYVKVQLSHPIKTSKLKAGDVVEGKLSRDVYSAERKVFPVGSPVRLTIDHLEIRKRIPNDHWPWVVKAFTPRHENYPVFKNATVFPPQGESSFDVSLISVTRMREVRAMTRRDKNSSASTTGAVETRKQTSNKLPTPTIVLEAFGLPDANPATGDAAPDLSPEERLAQTLPAGTHCRILLLSNISASKSKVGDAVPARLIEPVVINGKVALPAGTLFEGKVVKRTPPRWLSRAGTLYLTFIEATLPDGHRLPVAASLAGTALDERSHTRMDSEGKLHGERPGNAWMAINIGVTAGLAKEVDDGVQLVIEAIVSTATDVSTAGTARIVSSCVSGLYMATRHGRDVVLPRFTEMELSLDRPMPLAPPELKKSDVVTAGN